MFNFLCLISRLLVFADLVLRQLFALHTVQELLHAVASLVVATLGSEYHVHALDVVGDGERLGRAGTAAVDADLERTEAVQLHTLGVLHLVLHDLHQLLDDGHDVRALHGTVTLDNLC